jgi:hypothetical protein
MAAPHTPPSSSSAKVYTTTYLVTIRWSEEGLDIDPMLENDFPSAIISKFTSKIQSYIQFTKVVELVIPIYDDDDANEYEKYLIDELNKFYAGINGPALVVWVYQGHGMGFVPRATEETDVLKGAIEAGYKLHATPPDGVKDVGKLMRYFWFGE